MFFNDKLIGGYEKLKQLETAGLLDGMIKDCLEDKAAINFPPELRTPKGSEFAEVSYTFYSLLNCVRMTV